MSIRTLARSFNKIATCIAKYSYSHWFKSALPIFLGIPVFANDVSAQSTGYPNVVTNYTVMLSFDYASGSSPRSGVVLFNNLLYGTTSGGGNYGNGAAYVMSPDGTGCQILDSFISGAPYSLILVWTSVIYNTDFNATNDYILFNPSLLGTQDNDGGEYGNGAVFKLDLENNNNLEEIYTNFDQLGQLMTPSDAYTWGPRGLATGFTGYWGETNVTIRTSYEFLNYTNYVYTNCTIISTNYLTNCLSDVFTNYVYANCPDNYIIGTNYFTNCTPIYITNRFLPYWWTNVVCYGTTAAGGSLMGGVVYRMNTDGSDFTVLHDFNQGSEWDPGPLISLSIEPNMDVIFGMTACGSTAVWRMNGDGSNYMVLHRFDGCTIDDSQMTLTLGSNDQHGWMLYGAVRSGQDTLIFQLNPWEENYSVLYTIPNCLNVSLIWANNVLYGTAHDTGLGSWIFKINTDGTGYTVLHSFSGLHNDGSGCYGPLTFVTGISGNNSNVLYDVLYGTTVSGGTDGYGAVFGLPVNARSTVITSPSNGTLFPFPGNIIIRANATETDGTGISWVDFYQGATFIGRAFTAPYSISWNPAQPGTYALTAVATDNNGVVTRSAPVTITAAHTPPTVSIVSPSMWAFFTPPASITIRANATSSDGTVTNVDFYMNGLHIGTATTPPYSITVYPVQSCGNAPYGLTAKATDNYGVTTTSSGVPIIVDAPPTVSIYNPANGANFSAPANITISANATDSDGQVSVVYFYQGTTFIGVATAAPYLIHWNGVQPGTYTLTAKAIDNMGGTTTSSAITIQVH